MTSSNQWDRAVRIESTGTELYCTVGVACRDGHEQSVQFVLRVLDPNQSQAWSATFTAEDLSRMVADEQSMDLAPPLISTAVAVCISSGNLNPRWEGSSLYFECWFDTLNQAAIPAAQSADVEMLPRAIKLKLPPDRSMKAETGSAFNRINTGVLNSLMQQTTQMQQHMQLLDFKVSELQQHTQAVHDSYVCLVSKVERGELLSESGGLAGLKAGAVAKKPRIGHDTAAPTQSEITATQQIAQGGSQMYAGSPGANGFGATQTLDLNGSPGFRLAGPTQGEPAGVSGAAAGASGVSYTRRQRQQQQTRQEALRQRLLDDHKQLLQDWKDRVQQILQATNLADVQQLSCSSAAGQPQAKLQRTGYNRQNSGKGNGNLGSGKLELHVGSQQESVHKVALPNAAAATQPAAAGGGVVAATNTNMLADADEGEPELTAATARHVVRRGGTHTAKPLLVKKHSR